jgi:hypothetical protein
MPRSQPSRADAALIGALAAQGLHASPYQLERWRAAGLLPRNRRHGLGRGRGSVSDFDETTLLCAIGLATQARQGRATIGGHVIERFAGGLPLPEATVRAAFSAELDLLAGKLAVDAAAGDDGWQARHDAAERIARNAALVDLQDLLDALFHAPERPLPSPAAEHAAAQTIAHTLAAGVEMTPDDLLQAFAVYKGSSEEDLADLVASQHATELAGDDRWDEVAEALSLNRYRELLQQVSLAELQRATAAIYTAWILQSFVLLVGVWMIAEPDKEKVPARLRRINAHTLRSLQADPMWRIWGRHLSLPRRAVLVKVLVLSGLGVLMAPGLLDAVEGYRDRLSDLARPTEGDQQRGSSERMRSAQ